MAVLSESVVLSSCNVTKLADVKKLTVVNKHIQCIEVLRNCNALERADMNRNEIEDATALMKCKKLTWLSLANNRLKKMNFVEPLTKLTVLNLSYNQISDMSPLTSLKQLQALILSGNCITDVRGLDGMTQLNTLVLSHNRITVIDVKYLGSLTKLQLSHNKLTQFPNIKFNEDLKHLSLNDNMIERVPSDCLGDNNLEIVDLGKNKIRKYKFIKPLTELPTLKQLNLKGNALCEHKSYHKKVLEMFPDLKTFDSEPIGKVKTKLTEKRDSGLPMLVKKRQSDECNLDSSELPSSPEASLHKHKKLKTINNASSEQPSEDKQLLSSTEKVVLSEMHKVDDHSRNEKKKSKSKKAKDPKEKSGVVAIKDMKVKHSANITDLFSVIRKDDFGEGEGSSW